MLADGGGPLSLSLYTSLLRPEAQQEVLGSMQLLIAFIRRCGEVVGNPAYI